MATAVSPAFAFDMISRLPAASWELLYREVRPDIEQNGGVLPVNQVNRVSFHVRGATNEFALNTGIRLCGDVSMSIDFAANALASDLSPAEVRRQVCKDVNYNKRLAWRPGPTWIDSSRESFNSGSLPFADNQDTSLHLAYNNLRAICAKRTNSGVQSVADPALSADQGVFAYDIDDLAGAGHNSNAGYKGLNIWYRNATGAPNDYRKVDNGVYNFEVPIGFYSNLFNTPSVLPSGLMSAFSANGHSIEIRLADLVNSSGGNDPVVGYTGANGRIAGLQLGTKASKAGDGYRNLRLYVPFIRVLDPAAMEAILSLYEKRLPVSVGGVTFPMSLRLNSIGYRTYNFPLNADTGDYYFRLPCTDRSVRAVAWKLINNNAPNKFYTNVTGPVNTRLETRVGSLNVHPVVEDRTPYDRNLVKFYGLCKRRSGYVFSPFPYYQESQKLMNHQSDKYDLMNWADRDPTDVNIQWGVISFENMDYRTHDYNESFQASGYDLTAVGGVDLVMRFNNYAGNADDDSVAGYQYNATQRGTGVETTFSGPGAGESGVGPGANDWRIIFMLAYDSIHECSPSGVIEITNSVL